MTRAFIVITHLSGGTRVAGHAGGVLVAEERGLPPAAVAEAQSRIEAALSLAHPGHAALSVLVEGAHDAPVSMLPCRPLAEGLQLPPGARLVLPALAQAAPAEIAPTAALALAGVHALMPRFDGVICLREAERATWAHVSAGEVISLQGCLTGALLHAALSTAPAPDVEGEAFREALAETLSRPERLAARLASLGARARLSHAGPVELASRAAGWLMGAELASAKPWWLGQNVLVLSEHEDGMVAALLGQGVTVGRLDVAQARIAGLQLLAGEAIV